MKTIEEIVERCKKPENAFGFDVDTLVAVLPFEHAKAFLGPKVTEADWKDSGQPLTRESVLAAMREYMVFAWDKVDNHRGISTFRCVERMKAWLWLLGDEDLLRDFNSAPYRNYGAPKLKLLCERLGFSIPDSEDIQRMANGEPCNPSCDNGCGP